MSSLLMQEMLDSVDENKIENCFRDMLVRQKDVNLRVDLYWITKIHEGNWDYLFAGIEELVELAKCIPFADRIGYKWWSKAQDAEAAKLNAVIELVDAFHFFMSDDIACNSIEHIAQHYTENYIDAVGSLPYENLSMMVIIKRIISYCIKDNEFPSYLFFTLCLKLNVDYNLLYSVYVAKSELNKFRQDKGYKIGTYIKKWRLVNSEGVVETAEDNHFLIKWLIGETKANSIETTDTQIRAWLESTYSTILKDKK